MSCHEVKTYQWVCNGCGSVAVVSGRGLPTGWTSKTERVGPCGLTNYYRDETRDSCVTCTAAQSGDAEDSE